MTKDELCDTLGKVIRLQEQGKPVPTEFVKTLLYAHIDIIHKALKDA